MNKKKSNNPLLIFKGVLQILMRTTPKSNNYGRNLNQWNIDSK